MAEEALEHMSQIFHHVLEVGDTPIDHLFGNSDQPCLAYKELGYSKGPFVANL